MRHAIKRIEMTPLIKKEKGVRFGQLEMMNLQRDGQIDGKKMKLKKLVEDVEEVFVVCEVLSP